jgi:hypothetical protein
MKYILNTRARSTDLGSSNAIDLKLSMDFLIERSQKTRTIP